MTLADQMEETIKGILDRNRSITSIGNQQLAEMIRFHVARVIQSDAMLKRYETTPLTTRYYDD